MKKLVAWQEEPVMEAPVEKEEMGVTINMDNGENNFVGELVDEPWQLSSHRCIRLCKS